MMTTTTRSRIERIGRFGIGRVCRSIEGIGEWRG